MSRGVRRYHLHPGYFCRNRSVFTPQRGGLWRGRSGAGSRCRECPTGGLLSQLCLFAIDKCLDISCSDVTWRQVSKVLVVYVGSLLISGDYSTQMICLRSCCEIPESWALDMDNSIQGCAKHTSCLILLDGFCFEGWCPSDKGIVWVWPPHSNSDHQDYEPFLGSGIPT